MKSKKLTSVVVLMMSLIIMLGIFALPASAATSLSKATITYEVYQTYTGKAIKPSVTVKVGSKKLTKDKSYTVSYSDNKNVGKGYITIKGKGSYKGTIKKASTFSPKLLLHSKLQLTQQKSSSAGAKQQAQRAIRFINMLTAAGKSFPPFQAPPAP